MNPLNIALIGFGKSAEIFHAPFIISNPDYKLTAVLERNSEKSKTKYPFISIHKDIMSLLSEEDIEVVVITTPNSTHYDYAKLSLFHNKHVIVEKPFTVTTQQADELIQIAGERKLLLSVYQNRRWDGDYITIRNLISSGTLGEISKFESHFDRYRPELKPNSWKEEPFPGSGILYDLGSHLIDQCLQLFGVPKELYAEISKQREQSRIDDSFKLTLFYDSVKCFLTAGMMIKEPQLRLRIQGSKGTYIKKGLDLQENDLINGADPRDLNWGHEPEENHGVIISAKNGVHIERKIAAIPGNYQLFYKNVYECIRNNKELAVKPEQARDVIRVIELAYDSSAKRRILPFSH